MGLGFKIGAPLPAGPRLGGLGSPELLIQKIIDGTPARIGDAGHAAITAWGSAPNGVDFILHPAEEPLELRTNDGWLEATAKTSSAGPGYHAFAIEWLDRVAAEFNLAWHFEDEAREYIDETGFATARDFDALCDQFSHWFASLAGRLLETEATELALALPVGFQVRTGAFAISSMGMWEREWFEGVANHSTDPETAGRAYFPWWDRDRDQFFWLNCARVLAWVDVPWRAPQGDQETRIIENTLACFARARSLDPALELPEAEIAELSALLSDDPPARPAPTGIGFRRRPMRKPITGGWSVEVPGTFQETSEKEGRLIVFWDGTRTIRTSSFAFGPEPPPRPEQGEFLLDDGEHWGTASIDQAEEDGADYWVLHGEVRAFDGVCVTTIGFDDPTDREWAIETWKSLRALPPQR